MATVQISIKVKSCSNKSSITTHKLYDDRLCAELAIVINQTSVKWLQNNKDQSHQKQLGVK